MQKHLPFWILTLALLCALILPTLFEDGMFMDGLLYASVAKNLSEGIGTFWFPHFSKTLHSFFDQQPPLGFGIQALFFSAFGNGIYVERGYSFLTAILNAVLIVLMWRSVFENDAEKKGLAWLPIILWITVPVCFWAFSNNVMENTMSVFDLIAVLLTIRFLKSNSYLMLAGAGIFILLAGLTKGIQGLFPLAVVFAWWICYKNISAKKMLANTMLLILIPSILLILLLQNDSAYESLSAYLHNRVLNSIQHVDNGDGRFYLLGRLVSELLPMILFALIVILAARQKKIPASISAAMWKNSLFFLLIGIAASFPLMITLEQRGFYLATSLPYFALVAAIITAPILSLLVEKINIHSIGFTIFRTIAPFLLISVLLISTMHTGGFSRDKTAIEDVHLIGKIVPRGSVVGASYDLWSQWSFQEYLIRHYYICIDNKITTDNEFVVLETGTQASDSIQLKKINIPTTRFHLYQKTK